MPGSFTCVLVGLNANTIATGVIADVQLTLGANATTTSINILNAVGASPGGSKLPALVTTGGIVSVPLLSTITCTPLVLNEGQISTCSAALNAAAPAGGISVTLGSSNPLLTVPASVTVLAGGTTATFSASAAASIPSNQSATVTATLGSSSQSAAVSLVAPVLVSGIACDSASLNQRAFSTCTVTLNQNGPTGGANVTLASNTTSLTVPASVTVAAGVSSTTFSASAADSIATNQTATITATLGGASQTATIRLLAPVLLSGVACNPALLGPGGSTNCNVSLTQPIPGISLVRVTSCGPQTFPTSTCTIPGTGSGNLIVIGWQAGGGVDPSVAISSVTDNAGNTYAEAGAALAFDSVAGSVADVWYAANSVAGATTLTITPSAPIPNGRAVIWEFSGADLVAPLDQTATLNSQPATTTPAGAAVTTSAASDLVISLATAGNITGTQFGNTFISDSLVQGDGWAHLVTSAAGTYTPQWNQSSAGTYASSTVAFKAAENVTLTSNNPLLTVPNSVTVPVGASTASFSAIAASFAANQTATLSASFGASTQSASISLLAPVLISSVVCNATGVMSGASVNCGITLSRAVLSDATVSLTSSSVLLSTPASLTIFAGNATGSFVATAGTVLSNASATLSATLGVSAQSAMLLLWPTPKLSLLTCTPVKINVGATSTCVVTLSNAAGDLTIGISSSSTSLLAPATVAVIQGNSSSSFTVTAKTAAAHSVVLTASYNGASVSQSFVITGARQPQSSHGIRMQSISCEPGGSHKFCRLQLESPSESEPLNLSLESSNPLIKLPATITLQSGQSSVRFRVDSLPASNMQTATIKARLGADVAQETVSLDSRPEALGVPTHVYAKYGTPVEFQVYSSNPAALSASDLPSGAVFDAASGVFHWVPDFAARGVHRIVFAEVEPRGISITASSIIEVGSDTPVVDRVVNAASRSEAAACSPGAIASLEGRWLSTKPISDNAGGPTEPFRTIVRVNGIEVPILSASSSQLDFICPIATPGSSLEIVVQTVNGLAQPITTTSREAAPGIFSLDGSGTGQGIIVETGTDRLMMTPSYRYLSRAAMPDEFVTMYATGITGAQNVSVIAGGVEITPISITGFPNLAGVYEISIRLPHRPAPGDTPVHLKVRMLDGTEVASNEVSMATETVR